MPDYYINIPKTCPFHFVPVNPTQDARYNLKHFDDWWFTEQLKRYDPQVKFYQPVQQNDKMKIQVQSTIGAPQITIYDHSQRAVVSGIIMTVPSHTITGQPYEIYEKELDFSTIDGGDPLPEGFYWLYITAGSGDDIAAAIAEGIHVKQLHEDTILMEAAHNENDFDTAFETGFVSRFRFPGAIRPIDYDFRRKRSSYDDQIKNHRTLASVPYRKTKLIIADISGRGVPSWVADKVNSLIDLSTVTFDGKQFACDEEAQLEKQFINGYPMAAWTIDIREGLNRYSNRISSTGEVNTTWSVTYNIRTNMFGSLNAPPSTIDLQITDVE